MKVLVTGGTGFVGKHTVKKLSEDGHEVHYLTRGKSLGIGGPVHVDDIYDQAFWEKCLDGVSVVVHCMARVHILKEDSNDPYGEFKKVNVDATRALAEACLSKSVKKFIFLSTVGVYGTSGINITEDAELNPNGDYARSKREAEILLENSFSNSGVEMIILRPPLIYGPNAPGNFRSLESVISKRVPLPLGSIHNKRSFLYIQNLTQVISEIIKSNDNISGTYNVTDGEVVSTSYFLKNIAKHFSFAFIMPFPVFFLKLLGRLTGKMGAVNKLTDDLSFNCEKLKNSLGKAPSYNMNEALYETYRKN